jgi:hypothetical protein
MMIDTLSSSEVAQLLIAEDLFATSSTPSEAMHREFCSQQPFVNGVQLEEGPDSTQHVDSGFDKISSPQSAHFMRPGLTYYPRCALAIFKRFARKLALCTDPGRVSERT